MYPAWVDGIVLGLYTHCSFNNIYNTHNNVNDLIIRKFFSNYSIWIFMFTLLDWLYQSLDSLCKLYRNARQWITFIQVLYNQPLTLGDSNSLTCIRDIVFCDRILYVALFSN